MQISKSEINKLPDNPIEEIKLKDETKAILIYENSKRVKVRVNQKELNINSLIKKINLEKLQQIKHQIMDMEKNINNELKEEFRKMPTGAGKRGRKYDEFKPEKLDELYQKKDKFINWCDRNNIDPRKERGPVNIEIQESPVKKVISKLKKEINKKEQEKDILNNELRAAKNKVRTLSKRQGDLRAYSKFELKDIMDKHRFRSSDKVNCSAIGEEFGVSHETVKRIIEEKGLANYAGFND